MADQTLNHSIRSNHEDRGRAPDHPPGIRNGPGTATGTTPKNTGRRSENHSTASTPDLALLARRARRRDYAIRVVFERADGVICQQLYSGNLDAAEKKIQRCHERGLRADMQLVRVTPVGVTLDHSTVPATVAELLAEGGAR